ncbi:MAG: GtrA family protein [Lachnospiraceae bacterium]|nr:GtrA family protein [Lachnospiraceae bacterium]MBQ9563469.1 GtrA family protein [Lachnospiraceae bacterium]MBQ9593957.1 GtrA family protein [Lachnospiraceae bacterium]MBR0154159.1 GtrA family protein [Lachnospiraceae bacterium]
MLRRIWTRLTSPEVLLYLVFGVLTTLVDYVVFWLMGKVLGESMLMIQAANVIAWIAAVVFAFVTNKRWVFRSEERSFSGVAGEFFRFTGARLFSLLVSMGIIYVGVDLLKLSPMLSKIASSVVVVILNYIFSKWLVFRKKEVPQDEGSDEPPQESVVG